MWETEDRIAKWGTLVLSAAPPVSAQVDSNITLTVPPKRPLRVALTEAVRIRRVGQPVTATLVEPVYAYDRVVLPIGTEVTGQVARLDSPTRMNRTRALLSGDLSPHRIVVLQFDAVIRNGERMPVETVVRGGVPRVKRQFARSVEQGNESAAGGKRRVKDVAANAVALMKQRAGDTIATVRSPGKMGRLKEWAIDRLPYHPQVLRKATVYDAELQTALTFGTVPVHPAAPEGTMPAPSSVLNARLVTTLSSSEALRGMPIEAIVTEPVFAEDGRLIFAEGARLAGEVTAARPARRFHRNGQLRFLFERVEPPDRESVPMLASLHSVDVDQDDRVVLDDEGGAAVTNSKGRFVTPAVSILAMRATLEEGEGRGFEQGARGIGARTTSASVERGHFGARALGGFIGFGLIGLGLSRVSAPLGMAFSVAGAARSVYTNIFGKGQELRFQAATPIQVQLAPGRSPNP